MRENVNENENESQKVSKAFPLMLTLDERI
jgi:hypothetical protein